MNTIIASQNYIPFQSSTRNFSVMRTGIFILIIVIGLYVYTLVSTTMMVAEKRELESNIKNVSSKLSTAEVNYINLSSSFSSENMKNYGFNIASNVHFVNDSETRTNVAFAKN